MAAPVELELEAILNHDPELSLCIAQEQFEMVTAGVPNMLMHCSRDRRCWHVNRAYAEFLGREPEAIVGQPIQEILDVQTYEAICPYVERVLQGHRVEFELELEQSWKGWFCLSAVFTPHRDKQGSVLGWVGSLTDITQHVRTELDLRNLNAALRESEALFRNLSEAAPVMIWMVDTGELCTYVNQSLLRFRGETLEHLLGAKREEGIHPDDRQHWEKCFHAAFVARRNFKLEYRLRRHDGEYCWVLEHGRPHFTPAKTFAGYIGTYVDISERKQTEELLLRARDDLEKRVQQRTVELVQTNEVLRRELQEHKKSKLVLARLADIVESSSDAIFSVTRDLIVLSWNGSAERLTGFSSREMIGNPLPPAMLDSRDGQFERLIARALDGESVASFDMGVRRKNGGRIEAALTLSPIKTEFGRVTGCSFIARDVSERKQMEETLRQTNERYLALFLEAQAAKRNQRKLSSLVLHAQEQERKRISRELHDQVGQSLTAISVRLEALRRNRGVDDSAFREIQHLLKGTMEAAHDFARHLRPSVLDELGLLPALRSTVKEFTERTGLEVNLHANPLAEELSPDEKVVLFRVAQESLTNVAKHAQASRVEVDLRKVDGTIVMTVTDDGKSFRTDSNFRSRRKRLGLAGMQERVRLVNGQFMIEPHPGIGTTVRVIINLKSAGIVSQSSA